MPPKMKRILLAMFIASGTIFIAEAQNDSVPQVDLIDVVSRKITLEQKNARRKKSKVHFTFLPLPSSASGVNKVLFTSINASFYMGSPKKTNLSTIYFLPYSNFSDQYAFYIKPTIWKADNRWNFIGDYRISRYPQDSWGLGGSTDYGKKELIKYNYLRMYQNAMRNIGGSWVGGFGLALDYHFAISDSPADTPHPYFRNYSGDITKTFSAGFVLPVLFDSRRNSINPQGGMYLNMNYRVNPVFMGSDHTWQSLFVDFRKYYSFSESRQEILAFRTYYWTIVSGKVPYLDLPSNGWEVGSGTANRGFEQNRFRSNALIYAESEYRFDITENGFLGGVVFANFNSASQFGTQRFIHWNGALGTGIRLKLNKYSRTNLDIDYGISRNFQSIYINIGEVF